MASLTPDSPFDISTADLLLMVGEMTPQELRTVRAVLNGLKNRAERSLVDRPAPLDAPPDAPKDALGDQSQALRQSGAAASAITEGERIFRARLQKALDAFREVRGIMVGLPFERAEVYLSGAIDMFDEAIAARAVPQQHSECRVRFFTGLHQPSDARHFDAAFMSVNRLRNRKGPFEVGDWIMDSGAFSEISTHGHYRHSVVEYAEQIKRWKGNGRLLAAVAQDWMCEPHIVKRTGLSVSEHQRLTVERYDALLAEETGVYILPVIQGYVPADYVAHVRAYGSRLIHGAWVGVGSICKRNGDPAAIARVLSAIKDERPDLRLHGFGLKTTALAHPFIRSLLHTADSMAWSFAARRGGRNANDWREAVAWVKRITDQIAHLPAQRPLLCTQPCI